VTDVSEVLTASIIRAVTLMMEAVSTSETSFNFYETTRRKIPEDIFVRAAVKTRSLTNKIVGR
jgi:hypothetical protein